MLGVAPGATAQEVRSSYRALVRRLHPDGLGDVTDAERRLVERRMREINEAWAVLGDAANRTRYDAEMRRQANSAGADRFARAAAEGEPPTRAAQDSGGDDFGHANFGHANSDDDFDDDDFDEMTAAEVFILRRGPWIAAIVLALALLIGTAYAGGGSSTPEPVRYPQDQQNCVDTPAEPCGTATVAPPGGG